MKKLFLTVATAAMMFACTTKTVENPFLTEWNTPEGVPPFEQIKAEHYLPAFEEGIKQQQAEIEDHQQPRGSNIREYSRCNG